MRHIRKKFPYLFIHGSHDYNIIMVTIFQLIAYFMLAIFPIRLFPFPHRDWELITILPIVAIIFIFFIIKYVDLYRYWILGIIPMAVLLYLYTSYNAIIVIVPPRPRTFNFFVFSEREQAILYAIFICIIQLALCLLKVIVFAIYRVIKK